MPFIPPIITAGASVLGGIATFLNSGTLLAGIAKAGLGLAAQYAVGQLLKPKRPAQATQLQTAYGEDLARSVILGRVGIAGHHIYRNAFGKAGRTIQDVYVLSHFRSAGIKRVRFQGEWRALAAASSEYGLRVEGTGQARIWVRFHAGTMGQAADPQLIDFANPAGRWTVAHRLAGVSYAVVTYALDREHLSQPPELFAESEGAPLYDWRKDSSVGGSGAHRWADQSTWEFSTNPVLMMYALERGFFNGEELMVGKGVPAARLPLAEWTVAANICDETIEGKKRYQAALIAMAGQGSTHADNMQPLLDACAGSWVETAAGEFPIVGANQAVVASFGDDDIMPDEPFRFSRKRSRSELVNTAAGTFVNPENFYEQSPLATRIDETALAVDGERLAVSIGYGAVSNVEVGDRLLDIAIRASRYQANAEICLHPRFIRIQPGRWVRFNSAKHGDRKFLVLQKRLGAVGTNSARNVYLTLQEVGDGVFDPTAYVTVPPDVLVPGAPDYLAEVQNLTVAPILMQDENGAKRPGARVSWDAIDDVTVTHVQLRYRPVAQPSVVFYDTDTADVTVRQIANGLTSNSNWEVSSRLITRPSRTVAWSDSWVPFTTLDARFGSADVFDGVIDLKKLAQDVQDMNRWIGDSSREWWDKINALATLASDLDFRGYDDKETLRREIAAESQDTRAKYTEAIGVATSPNSAMGIRMEQLEVSVAGKASASTLDILNVQVFGNTGVASRVTAVEVTIPKLATVSALDALETSIGSDMSLLAGRTSAVEARQNGDSANATFKMTAGYMPAAGWSARIGMQARIDANGTAGEKLFRTAGLFLEVNATSARAVFDVSQFIITDSTTNIAPFIFSGGEAYMENARIGTVHFNQLSSVNNKLIIKGSGSNASIEIFA